MTSYACRRCASVERCVIVDVVAAVSRARSTDRLSLYRCGASCYAVVDADIGRGEDTIAVCEQSVSVAVCATIPPPSFAPTAPLSNQLAYIRRNTGALLD